MSRRQIVGRVAGGGDGTTPRSIEYDDVGRHAARRLDAMQEMIVQLAALKAGGAASTLTTPTGARFQDFTGTRANVAAHRAIFAPTVDGFNPAFLRPVARNPALRDAIIAPQARTDFLPKFANYGDRLFEIVAQDRTVDLMRRVMDRHKPSGGLEFGLLHDAMFELQELYDGAYQDAMDLHESIMSGRGWTPKRLRDLLLSGAASPEDGDTADIAEAELQVGGPSQFGEAALVMISVSKDASAAATPEMTRRATLEEQGQSTSALVATAVEASAKAPTS